MYVQSVEAPPPCGGWHRRGGNVAWPGIVWDALRACPRCASSRTPVLPGLATCLGRGRGAVGHGACPRRDGDLRASRSRTLTRARRRGPARSARPNEQGIIVRLRDMPLRPPAPLASWLIVAAASLGAGLLPGSLWLYGNKRRPAPTARHPSLLASWFIASAVSLGRACRRVGRAQANRCLSTPQQGFAVLTPSRASSLPTKAALAVPMR